MKLYNYEFSIYSNDDINEYGYYGYEYIDDYWNEQGRFPYSISIEDFGKFAIGETIFRQVNFEKRLLRNIQIGFTFEN